MYGRIGIGTTQTLWHSKHPLPPETAANATFPDFLQYAPLSSLPQIRTARALRHESLSDSEQLQALRLAEDH